MTLYSAVLFGHILCVLGLFVALSFEWVTLSRLRAAANIEELRVWANPVPALPLVAMSSVLLLLFTGIYLTVQLQAWTLAWPKVSFFGLLLIAPLGAVTGKRMRAIRRAIEQGSGANFTTLRKSIGDPFLGVSLGIRTAFALGIVLIMAAKPSLYLCLGILALALVIGTLWSISIRRPAAALPSGD